MVSDAVKLERAKRKTAREERMWRLVSDPTIKRLALLAGIVGYSAYVSGKGEEAGSTETALAIAMPTVGIPLLAAEAGITDWKVLLALAAACGGIATISSDKAVDAVTIEGPGGYPLVSLLGPVAGLRFVSKEISKRV
jgi:hypothetical protein